MVEDLKPGQRVTGEAREELITLIKRLYVDEGKSVRAIGDLTGRSYGAVHRVLSQAGVELRRRGGNHRGPIAPPLTSWRQGEYLARIRSRRV